MKVPRDVLDALQAATTDTTRLLLAGPKMTPQLYQRVNEVIEGAGGRWDKTVGAHVFPGDAAAAIAPVLTTGRVTTVREARASSQYFPTPAPIVGRLLRLAQLAPGMDVLEPSAGRGAIAVAVAARGCQVDCVEQDPGHAEVLQESGAARSVTVADFLAVPADPRFDRVIMNPPFTLQADVAHVSHALGFLKPGGLLVAVMSRTVAYHPSARTFRDLLERHGGKVEALPEGAFAASGTGARTVCVTIPASRPAGAQPVVWPTEFVSVADEPEHQDPAVIAAQIAADLRKASALFDRVARSLAAPAAREPHLRAAADPPPCDQLDFDGLGDALEEASCPPDPSRCRGPVRQRDAPTTRSPRSTT